MCLVVDLFEPRVGPLQLNLLLTQSSLRCGGRPVASGGSLRFKPAHHPVNVIIVLVFVVKLFHMADLLVNGELFPGHDKTTLFSGAGRCSLTTRQYEPLQLATEPINPPLQPCRLLPGCCEISFQFQLRLRACHATEFL